MRSTAQRGWRGAPGAHHSPQGIREEVREAIVIRSPLPMRTAAYRLRCQIVPNTVTVPEAAFRE